MGTSVIPFPDKKYRIIYADPPWSYNDKRGGDKGKGHGGATAHYPTMNIEDIKALPVKDLADDNSMLFLWVTFPLLKDGLDLIEAWGFKYKTLGFSWTKTNPKSGTPFFGMGWYTKSNAEVCLIGIKGKPFKASNKVSSAVIAPIGRHLEKPAKIRDRIVEFAGDLPRIELFARESAEGWDAWGNEI